MAQEYPPLLIHPDLAKNLRAIQSEAVQDEDARQLLGVLLQHALELEFATVPPYLSAAFSLNSENEGITKLISRIAREEMLHMTVVANLMNAIGVAPDIKAAVPEYPYDLDVIAPALRLDLRSFSTDLVKSLFLRIETPEDPPVFPAKEVMADEQAELPNTIGQFYENIIEVIRNDTIPDLFKNTERDSYKQIRVLPNFRRFAYLNNQEDQEYRLKDEINFVIADKESAIRHLMWVVDQGEGAAPLDPLTPEGIPGHYYRFQSILKHKYLVKDEAVPDLGHSYSGADLPFDRAGVHEFETNVKVENYVAHPRVEKRMNQFNELYTQMIDLLHSAFNCPSPEMEQEAKEAYDASITIMRRMPKTAGKIIRAAASSGVRAGAPFQYKRGEPVIA